MAINQIGLWELAGNAFDSRHKLVEEQHYALPTPCADFDVAALIQHAIGTQIGFGRLLGGAAEDGASWKKPHPFKRECSPPLVEYRD